MHKGEETLNQAQENATETQAASVRVKPGIDYEKLKSIGVPDEVIASLDPRDGGNITPQGKCFSWTKAACIAESCQTSPCTKTTRAGWESKTSS